MRRRCVREKIPQFESMTDKPRCSLPFAYTKPSGPRQRGHGGALGAGRRILRPPGWRRGSAAARCWRVRRHLRNPLQEPIARGRTSSSARAKGRVLCIEPLRRRAGRHNCSAVRSRWLLCTTASPIRFPRASPQTATRCTGKTGVRRRPISPKPVTRMRCRDELNALTIVLRVLTWLNKQLINLFSHRGEGYSR